MKKRQAHILGLAGIVLGLTLLVSLTVVFIGMVVKWKTLVQYSNGIFAAGAVFIVLGILSVTGGFQQRASFSITYAESAGQASLSERAQRMVADINQRYGAMILLIGTGLFLIIISIGVHQLL